MDCSFDCHSRALMALTFAFWASVFYLRPFSPNFLGVC